jgi:ubiquinone/menaquinone biosynthesis C-methylase UbiE
MSRKSLEEVMKEWRGSALYWEMHAGTIREMFEPITQAMIEGVEMSDWRTALDVAGGTGEPSLAVARKLGPRGMIVCTDGALEMVATARKEARAAGLSNIGFANCIGDSLPFQSDLFDATLSRLGAMFFIEPEAGLREMWRVTKPGGSLLLAVWGRRELNPFFTIVTDVMARYLESPPEDPEAPGAFRFCEPGKLASVVERSLWRDVSERTVDFYIESMLDAKEFWALRSEVSDTLRSKLKKLAPEQAAKVGEEVESAARVFFPDDRMKLPAQVIIVSARK